MFWRAVSWGDKCIGSREPTSPLASQHFFHRPQSWILQQNKTKQIFLSQSLPLVAQANTASAFKPELIKISTLRDTIVQL